MDELRTLRPVPRWLFTGWYDVIMDPGSSKLLLWLLSFTRDRESSSSRDEKSALSISLNGKKRKRKYGQTKWSSSTLPTHLTATVMSRRPRPS